MTGKKKATKRKKKIKIIKATGWKDGDTVESGEQYYRLQLEIVGSTNKGERDALSERLNDWSVVGVGSCQVDGKKGELFIYRKLFGGKPAWRYWAKQFPFPLYEESMRTGKKSFLNKKKMEELNAKNSK